MFIAASFITAKRWNQQKYPSTGGQRSVVYQCSRILPHSQKERTIDVYNNLDESQTSPCRVDKARSKGFHTMWFHLSDILEKTRYGP